ncbi:GPI ethanolamine phosphate transferase 1 [Fasciolopsis buskii]|uniref:GPI ethanolamine phosphate transferase 1 n=1 Tax=Fasciolopsis buskii TaxID=27845 RepID=A0A8E0RWL2_9TREM|nr:GPI ethanolamine phosphate transferase 1 [Fasciolopsis buski]
MVNIPSDNSVSSAVFIVCLSLMRVQLILTWYLLPPFFCSHPTFGCVLLCSSAARYSNLGVARGRGYSIGSVEHTVSSSYCSLLCNDEFKGCLEVWCINTIAESDFAAASAQVPGDISSQLLTRRNFRQSLLFIFLLVFSFFGTGNIASVNSTLVIFVVWLIFQVLCPMVCLGIIYAAVQLASGRVKPIMPLYTHTQDAVSAQMALTTVLSNFIAVHFFAWLRDEGSWLEIGNSISHYVIAMAFGFAALLFSRFGRCMLTCHLRRISFYVEPVWRKHI